MPEPLAEERVVRVGAEVTDPAIMTTTDARLGLATTRRLLEEVCARLVVNARHVEACEVARLAFALPDYLLDYLTVDEAGDVEWLNGQVKAHG